VCHRPRARREAYPGRSPADKGETRSCESPSKGEVSRVIPFVSVAAVTLALARFQKRLGIATLESPRANTGKVSPVPRERIRDAPRDAPRERALFEGS